MDIVFPRYVRWYVSFVNSDPFSPFGSQTRYRIRKSAKVLKESGYTFEFEDVNDLYLDKFVPVYEEYMRAKERGTIFPVRDRITEGEKKGKKFQALSLYDKNHVFIGGMIFSNIPDKDTFSINYKVFPLHMEEKIPIAVTFVAEFYFYEYAVGAGHTQISHGLDRNLYGYFSNIGLAAHKVQAGARPFTPLTNISDEPNEILCTIPVSTEDMFIFTGSEHEQYISSAIFVSDKNPDELKQKFPILFSSTHFETTILKHEELPRSSEWK